MLECSIQSWVNADGPPFGSFDVRVSAGDWTTVSLSGWLPFADDFLPAMGVGIHGTGLASYTVDLVDDAGSPRVRLLKTAGADLAFRWPASMAQLLGFSGTETGVSTEITGDMDPDGYCQAWGLLWGDPEPGKATHLTQYRHGRTLAMPWGTGAAYELTAVMPWADYVRLAAGPASAGKVRFFGLDGGPPDGSPMDADHPDGYIDGYIIGLPRKEPVGDLEETIEASFRVFVPALADRDTRAQSLGDAVLGPLKRGFDLVYYVVIEGIPKVIAERSLGLTKSGYSTFAGAEKGLVIDQSGSVGWSVDRSKGLVNSNSLSFGVLDAGNELGYWAKPTAAYGLFGTVEPTDTEIRVKDSIDSAPDTGALYLGKEYLTYTSKDLILNRFLGVTRGVHGPTYRYPAKSIQPYDRVTAVPLLTTWAGRFVELWAALVDPYGRAVGSAYDDSYCKMLFLGTVSGYPAYKRGVFSFTAHSIERRLTTKIGGTSHALTDGRSSDLPEHVYLYVPEGASIDVWMLTGFTPADGTTVTVTFDGSPGEVAGTRQTLKWVAKTILNKLYQDLVVFGGISLSYLQASDFKEVGPGVLKCSVVGHVGTGGGFQMRFTANANTPAWFAGLATFTAEETVDWYFQLLADNHLMISERGQADLNVDALPDSGYAIIGEGDGAELIHYTAKEALADVGGDIYALAVDERQIGATKIADWTQVGLTVRSTVYLNDTLALALLRLLHSSGIAGLRSADYDVYSHGWGYGLDERYVHAASFTLFPSDLGGKVKPILGEPISLDELFGGLIAAQWRALGPVRPSGSNRLCVGLIDTRPVQGLSELALTDESLMLNDAGDTNDLLDGPSMVRFELGASALSTGENVLTQRNVPAIDAKGGAELKFEIHGLTPAAFYAFCPLIGQMILADTMDAFSLQLSGVPWLDYLPGQAVQMDLTHPGLWNTDTGRPGFTGYGRVYGVSRNLVRKTATLTVHTGGTAYGVLCPGVLVTSVVGNRLTVGTVNQKWFEGDDWVRILTPGLSTEDTVVEITAVGAGYIEVAAVPAWVVAGETIITYPNEGAGTVKQNAFVHIDDGNRWE